MPHWVSVLVIALGGAMFLEGALYALFPSGMKKAMSEMQNMPDSMLRSIGLGIAAFGVVLVYFMLPK